MEKMIDEIVQDAIKQHKKKVAWQVEQEVGRAGSMYQSAKDAASFNAPNHKPESSSW